MVVYLRRKYNIKQPPVREFLSSNYKHWRFLFRFAWIFHFCLADLLVLSQQKYSIELHYDSVSNAWKANGENPSMNALLNNYYTKGYALAIWQLDSVCELHPMSMVGYYTFQPGKIITHDSIIGAPSNEIRPKILAAMLDWKKDKIFVHQELKKNLTALNQLDWFSIEQQQLFFHHQKAILRIKPVFKKANELNALIGLQPNVNGKSTLVGDFHFLLVNRLRHAEKIEVQWQRQAVNTQRLQVELILPYCFGTPFGIGSQLDLYRRSDLFLQTQSKLAIQYKSHPMQTSEFFLHQQSTISLGNERNTTINQRTAGVQLRYQWKQPFWTFGAISSFSTGKRILQANDAWQKSSILTTEHTVSIRPKWKKLFFSTQLHYWFQSTEANQSSEWKRIGGNATLRGFQQESIFARTGATAQNALGIGDENAQQFFIFADFGRLNLGTQPYFQTYWSWGIGAIILAPNGGIKINYGWGQFPHQKIEYRNGIINLSYQVYF